MGRIYLDQRTGWWIADYVDAAGKRRRTKAARDPHEARKTLSVLEGQAIRYRALDIKPPKPIRFREYAELYLKHVKAELRCYRRYRVSVRHHIQFFDKSALTAINPEMVERFKQMRLAKVCPGTVNRDLAVLRRMLNLAIAWGYLRENPLRFFKFPKERNGRLRYLTREEFERLVEACPDWLKPIVTIAVNTGMRQGEIVRLTWSDVDLENGFAAVNDPKNGIPRKVPLNETARAAFEEVKQGSSSIKAFPVSQDWVQHEFARIVKVAGIVDFKFHDLRHTCASWLVMAGVEILKVKEVLDHKDIRMTLRYAHLSPDQAADAVRKLDSFNRSKPSSTAL